MFRVTCINLKNGERALYINGHYLACDDGSNEKFPLEDILKRLSRLPGVTTETVQRPVPDGGEWRWDDVAEGVFPVNAVVSRNDMTIGAFKLRLSGYPEGSLCCGTFWLEDDFLTLDSTLTAAQVEEAMELAEHRHDANIGFNWEHLQAAIDSVKGE